MALLTRLSHEIKFNALLRAHNHQCWQPNNAFLQWFISYIWITQNDIIWTQKRNDVWSGYGSALSEPTKPKLVEHSQEREKTRDACICGLRLLLLLTAL